MAKQQLAIGDLAKQTGTKVNTIRYYEDIGLLPVAARTPAGRRFYSDRDTRRLAFIRQSRSLGFPLESVRDLLALADDTTQSCEAVDRIARHHLTDIDRKIASLSSMRAELDRVIGSCRHGTVADCKIIETLAPRS
jgi:DNA-binding transcriptional MerR regulator